MSTLLLQQQIAKLDGLPGCPVCGAKPRHRYGGHKNRRISFECEAIFIVEPNSEIRVMVPCPAPSDTAAMMLNAEILAEADRLAQAGAA